MKTVKTTTERKSATKVTFGAGSYVYELDENWGNLPEDLSYQPFCTGCCDRDDNIYLISRDYYNPIIKLDKDGNFLKGMGAGLFTFIHGIYLTPNNTLLCTESDMHVIRELSMDGEHIRDIGEVGKASDSGYDPHIWRRRMMQGDIVPLNIEYDRFWAFADSISSIKRAAPPFNKPTAAGVNSKGELYVTDGYGNAAVHKFSPEYDYIKTWGGPGREPGKFLVPHGICVDSLDRVWVADREGSSVHVFDGDGELLAYFSPQTVMQPSDIWSDPEYVYIGERGGITIVNMDMEIETQIGYPFSPLMVHGLFGNSKSELFITPLGLPFAYNHIRKLARIK